MIDRETANLALEIVIAVVLVAAFAFLCYWLINIATVKLELAQIEQLRHDVGQVPACQSEDVIGQAVDKNRWIAAMQAANRLWWLGWTIPDAYDQVEMITLPNEETRP